MITSLLVIMVIVGVIQLVQCVVMTSMTMAMWKLIKTTIRESQGKLDDGRWR